MKDARIYQILILGLLLSLGAYLRDFSITPEQIYLTFFVGLFTQMIFIFELKLKNIGYLSALITCMGLTLLLRADNLWAHPLAAFIAISSKFLIRYNNKHIFNPANLGVLLGVLILPGTWISSGQWGHDMVLAGWLFVLGNVVVYKARRGDISWKFLGFFVGLMAIRILWLETRWEVLYHQLESGTLLLFSFFMISDPMTIPNHSKGRWVYALLVASIAFVWQNYFYNNNGLLWAVLFTAPVVPLLDKVWAASKFNWNNNLTKDNGLKGGSYENNQETKTMDPLGRTVIRPIHHSAS